MNTAVRGADVMFVQADTGAERRPAIALYERLRGRAERMLHLDSAVDAPPRG